jgi:hypothetical protein
MHSSMADDQVWHPANVPADFPTHDCIVNSCVKAGFSRNGVCIRVAGKPRFWVKYGNNSVIRGEGLRRLTWLGSRTPTLRASFASPISRGSRGYIVMDFVQGTTLAQRKSPKGNYYKNDIKAVAAAVQQLTDIKMPAGTAPGPVGGGRIGHDLFVECLSTLIYPTVGHLEVQIN